ncbi:universal stress protein [Hydrogenophaga aquatica]
MFKNILVVVDDKPASLLAISQGVEIARVNDGQILFFHWLPDFNGMPIGMNEATISNSLEYEREVRTEAHTVLQKASSMAKAAGVRSSRVLGTGRATNEAQCVADVADRRHCELIVVATERRNALIRLIGGSIVPGLISKAKMPVMVCQYEHKSGKRSNRLATRML